MRLRRIDGRHYEIIKNSIIHKEEKEIMIMKENKNVYLCIYGSPKKVSKCKALLKENFQQPYEEAVALEDLEKAISLLKPVGADLNVMLGVYFQNGEEADESLMQSVAFGMQKNSIPYQLRLKENSVTINCNEFSNIEKAIKTIEAVSLQAELVG